MIWFIMLVFSGPVSIPFSQNINDPAPFETKKECEEMFKNIGLDKERNWMRREWKCIGIRIK